MTVKQARTCQHLPVPPHSRSSGGNALVVACSLQPTRSSMIRGYNFKNDTTSMDATLGPALIIREAATCKLQATDRPHIGPDSDTTNSSARRLNYQHISVRYRAGLPSKKLKSCFRKGIALSIYRLY